MRKLPVCSSALRAASFHRPLWDRGGVFPGLPARVSFLLWGWRGSPFAPLSWVRVIGQGSQVLKVLRQAQGWCWTQSQLQPTPQWPLALSPSLLLVWGRRGWIYGSEFWAGARSSCFRMQRHGWQQKVTCPHFTLVRKVRGKSRPAHSTLGSVHCLLSKYPTLLPYIGLMVPIFCCENQVDVITLWKFKMLKRQILLWLKPVWMFFTEFISCSHTCGLGQLRGSLAVQSRTSFHRGSWDVGRRGKPKLSPGERRGWEAA